MSLGARVQDPSLRVVDLLPPFTILEEDIGVDLR